MSKLIITPIFRVSFPHVFEPTKNTLSNKDQFSVTMLFSKDTDLSEMKRAAMEAIKEKWGDTLPPNIKKPFRDGDKEKSHLQGYAGCIFVAARSDRKPGLVDENVKDIIDRAKFYAGCYARAEISAFAYEARNPQGIVISRGVSFGLNNIQKVKDGEAFGAQASDPKKIFGAVEGAVSPESAKVADDFFDE